MFDQPRAQSESVGVVLLTGVIVITVGIAGTAILADAVPQSETPVVDIRADATDQSLTVTHNGGDTLDASAVDVIVDGTRYPLDSFTQQAGTDPSGFNPGDSWSRSVPFSGEQIQVSAVHVPSNTVLDTERVNVEVTIAARFSSSPAVPTSSDTVTFDASASSVEGSSIASYAWDFGDDGTVDATGQTNSTSYPDDGTYPVNLTVTAADGRTATTVKTVTVYNEFPTASFGYTPSNPSPGEDIEFDASASSDADGTVQSYAWEFDDSGTTDTTGAVVTTDFSSAGEYPVVLTVTDDDGDTDRAKQVVSVGSFNPPTVTITGTTISETGNSGKYDLTVTFEASDPDGDITNYTATLYDSSSRTTQIDQNTSASSASGAYDGSSTTVSLSDGNRAGTSPYYIVVRVGDSTDRVDEESRTVAANNQAPTAEFDYSPTNPSPGTSVEFDASASSDPDGDSLTYEWDWTGDGTYDATTSDPTRDHTYGSEGSYDATLRVSDGLGGTATKTRTVTVSSGGGSGSNPPSATVSVTDRSSCSRLKGNGNCNKNAGTNVAKFDVDWTASDDVGISDVRIELLQSGTRVDSANPSASGTSASGFDVTLTDQGGWNQDYTIEVTVTDSDAQRTTASTTQTADSDDST